MEFLALAVSNSKYKGGILGTIPKRLVIFSIPSILIVMPLALLLGVAGGGPTGAILALIATIGAPIAGALYFDQDTLRWNKSARVWRAKFDQVMMKARSLRGDAEFSNMLDYYEKQVKK